MKHLARSGVGLVDVLEETLLESNFCRRRSSVDSRGHLIEQTTVPFAAKEQRPIPPRVRVVFPKKLGRLVVSVSTVAGRLKQAPGNEKP